jgi:hypothetical protein
MFSDTVLPKPGFRGTLGYGWRWLRFSLVSGYTYITGTNPFVQDLAFIPLTFRLGYEQPLGRNFSIRADLGGGVRFTEVNKYGIEQEDGSKGKVTNEARISPTVEGCLSVAFKLPEKPLQIYAGYCTSLLYETKGPVFHPAFEAGLVFKIPKKPMVINIAAIEGVTVPVTDEPPVTTVTDTEQYTGTVTWSPAIENETFAAETAYTATIILEAKPGYTLQGVQSNFFTVAGAAPLTYTANSNEVKAVFPETKHREVPVNEDPKIDDTENNMVGT